METRIIAGREVCAIGMGVMPLSFDTSVTEDQAMRTVCAALDAGVQLLDTATCYVPNAESPGHNERIAAAGVRAWGGDADSVLIASKGGHHRASETDFPKDGRPEAIHAYCDASLAALGTDCIDLYQYHWVDPKVPLVETMGAFRDLKEAGKIRAVGLSNVTVEEVEAASSVVEIASVQNRLSPDLLDSVPVVRHCAERGIAFLPYCPLGGSGKAAATLGERLPAFGEVASRHGVSPQQVALAWMLALSPNIIPIPGARRPETIVDSAGAADLRLTPRDLATLG